MKKINLLISLLLISMTVFSNEFVAVESSEWRPYVYMENDKPTGLGYVIVKDVFERANMAYKFKIKPWARIYNNGLNKKNYFISGIGRTAKRDPLFQWIGPITKGTDVYFYKLKSNPIQLNSLEEAKKYQAGVERGTFFHDYLNTNFKPNKIYPVSRPDLLLRMLLKKRFSFILLEESRLTKVAEKLDIDPNLFEKSLFAFNIQEYLAASMKTDKKLVNKLKKAYIELEKENRINLL